MVRRLFLDHPAQVGESYGQHFQFALGVSATLFVAAFGALIHAFIPAACERTASRIIARLYARTHNRVA